VIDFEGISATSVPEQGEFVGRLRPLKQNARVRIIGAEDFVVAAERRAFIEWSFRRLEAQQRAHEQAPAVVEPVRAHRDDGELTLVIPASGRTAQALLTRGEWVTPCQIHAFTIGVLRALAILRERAGRFHGELDGSAILLGSGRAEGRVRLTKLPEAPEDETDAEQSDLASLGRMILGLATRRRIAPRAGSAAVKASDFRAFGALDGKWERFVKDLLDGGLRLDEALRRARRLRPPRLKTTDVLKLGVAASLATAAGIGVWLLFKPTESDTHKMKHMRATLEKVREEVEAEPFLTSGGLDALRGLLNIDAEEAKVDETLIDRYEAHLAEFGTALAAAIQEGKESPTIAEEGKAEELLNAQIPPPDEGLRLKEVDLKDFGNVAKAARLLAEIQRFDRRREGILKSSALKGWESAEIRTATGHRSLASAFEAWSEARLEDIHDSANRIAEEGEGSLDSTGYFERLEKLEGILSSELGNDGLSTPGLDQDAFRAHSVVTDPARLGRTIGTWARQRVSTVFSLEGGQRRAEFDQRLMELTGRRGQILGVDQRIGALLEAGSTDFPERLRVSWGACDTGEIDSALTLAREKLARCTPSHASFDSDADWKEIAWQGDVESSLGEVAGALARLASGLEARLITYANTVLVGGMGLSELSGAERVDASGDGDAEHEQRLIEFVQAINALRRVETACERGDPELLPEEPRKPKPSLFEHFDLRVAQAQPLARAVLSGRRVAPTVVREQREYWGDSDRSWFVRGLSRLDRVATLAERDDLGGLFDVAISVEDWRSLDFVEASSLLAYSELLGAERDGLRLTLDSRLQIAAEHALLRRLADNETRRVAWDLPNRAARGKARIEAWLARVVDEWWMAPGRAGREAMHDRIRDGLRLVTQVELDDLQRQGPPITEVLEPGAAQVGARWIGDDTLDGLPRLKAVVLLDRARSLEERGEARKAEFGRELQRLATDVGPAVEQLDPDSSLREVLRRIGKASTRALNDGITAEEARAELRKIGPGSRGGVLVPPTGEPPFKLVKYKFEHWDGERELAFVLVGVDSQVVDPVYIGATEAPLWALEVALEEDFRGISPWLPSDKDAVYQKGSNGIFGYVKADRGTRLAIRRTWTLRHPMLDSSHRQHLERVHPEGMRVDECTLDHPIHNIKFPGAVRTAAILGCRLPTPSEWEHAYQQARERNRLENVADLQWVQQNRHRIDSPQNARDIPAPDKSSFARWGLDDTLREDAVEQLNAMRNRLVDDGYLWLRPCQVPDEPKIQDMVGNVAEWVALPGVSEPMQAARIIGGTAFVPSPPGAGPPLVRMVAESAISERWKTAYWNQSYPDVGMRLAFSAGRAADPPLLRQYQEAMQVVFVGR